MCLYWDSTVHVTFVMHLVIPFPITISLCRAAAELRSNCSCDSYILVSCFVLWSGRSAERGAVTQVCGSQYQGRHARFTNQQQESLTTSACMITTT